MFHRQNISTMFRLIVHLYLHYHMSLYQLNYLLQDEMFHLMPQHVLLMSIRLHQYPHNLPSYYNLNLQFVLYCIVLCVKVFLLHQIKDTIKQHTLSITQLPTKNCSNTYNTRESHVFPNKN